MGFFIDLKKAEFQRNLKEASWKQLLIAALAVQKKAKEYAPRASLALRKSISIIEKNKEALTLRVGSALPYAVYQHEEMLNHLGEAKNPGNILAYNNFPTTQLFKKRKAGDLKARMRSSMTEAKYNRNYRALKQTGQLRQYKSEFLYNALQDTDITGIMTEGLFGK